MRPINRALKPDSSGALCSAATLSPRVPDRKQCLHQNVCEPSRARSVKPQMSPEIPSGNLLPNLILFGRLLHGLGLDTSVGRMMDVYDALQYIKIGQRPDFYHTLRSLLV